MSDSVFYLAYGENINWKNMRHYCPTARVLGQTMLENYRLTFRAYNGGGIANIEPYFGRSVPAVIWKITPKDVECLDYYQELSSRHRMYISVVDRLGTPLHCIIYGINEKAIYAKPTQYHRNLILDGYREYAFDPKIIFQAVHETQICMNQQNTITLERKIVCKKEDIAYIAELAFRHCLSRWADQAEYIGNPLGSQISEHFSSGGTVNLHDSMADQWYSLDKNKFYAGLALWYQQEDTVRPILTLKGINTRNVDEKCADAMIQYSLFGKIVYKSE